jgi:hypothetical protein
VITLRLTLKPGRDDDLIALVLNTRRGKLAETIRTAMRSGIREKFTEQCDDDFEIPDISLEL